MAMKYLGDTLDIHTGGIDLAFPHHENSGSDIAAETAGIVLVNSNPKDIVSLILFGKATYRKMIQNLIWATGYNVIALPLAAGILYKQGVLLSPAAGAVLMTVSTIVVAINASMLKVK